eukprot:6845204-Pyramimonas_sp.AAC.1
MASKTAEEGQRCFPVNHIMAGRSRWVKEGQRCMAVHLRGHQDGPNWPQDGRRRPERPPSGIQDGPRSLQEVLQEGPKKPKLQIAS